MNTTEDKGRILASALAVAVVVLLLAPCIAEGQDPGENIETIYGFVSAIPGVGDSSRTVVLHPPISGKDYKVKVYFLKAEVSATMIDAYYDNVNSKAQERGEDSGSETWDKIRAKIQGIESEAEYEVTDTRGTSIGRIKDIGLVPFFKTVKFRATSPSYSVRLRCLEGAGLFRLVFEYN